MWNQLSLKTKMVAAFSVAAFLLLLQGLVTYYFVGQTMTRFRGIVTMAVPNKEQLHRIELAVKDVEIPVDGLKGSNNTRAQAEESVLEITRAIAHFDAAAKSYEAIPFIPGEEEVWLKFKNERWKPYTELALKAAEIAKEANAQAYHNRDALVEKEFLPARGRLTETLVELQKIQSDAIEADSAAALQSSRTLTTTLWIMVLAGALSVLTVGILFAAKLAQALGSVAERLGNGSSKVADAAKSISSSGAELSANTTEQAAALQETVSSVDEISAMVSKNADNAKKSQEISQRSHQTTTRGQQAVQEMIQSIEEISRSNDEITAQIETSNREISDIVKVISEIGAKTRVINDIVFQTKLLSFNASVEAARAGEHGKGFAVVAEEVGNLAQMSGNAAKEISQMLEGSIQRVEKIVTDTRTKVERLVVAGKSKVETGTTTAKRCGTVLDEIVKDVSEVNQMIDEIANASQEQSQGVHEITKAMAQLDQVTQQNAAGAQQSANASEQLSAQADELRKLVRSLQATVRGGDGMVSAPAVVAVKAISAPAAKAAPVKSSAPNNVIPLKAKPPEAVDSPPKPAALDDIPSEDDPRFEEA